jgi:preprotein translocase subunit SecG
VFVLAEIRQYFFGISIFTLSVFLILLVLVQRGRGGGLTGALGGPGGQSAFGTKAGDIFTRITIVTAALWIFLCVLAVRFIPKQLDIEGGRRGQPVLTSPLDVSPGTGESGLGESGLEGLGGLEGLLPGGETPPAEEAPSEVAPAEDGSEAAAGTEPEPAEPEVTEPEPAEPEAADPASDQPGTDAPN